MSNIKILLQALNSVWLIEPDAAKIYSLALDQILTGQKSLLLKSDKSQTVEFYYTVNVDAKKTTTSDSRLSSKVVAVINLQGAVMKYDYCGAPGTQTLMNALQQANDDSLISAIILQIDSPGGAVDGTQQFANAIKNSSKPVVAYVNGMMASAAMWIGSAASKRIASSNTDMIGSIGTMAVWRDYKGMYEKYGIKIHEVYATASTQKNLPFREAEGNNKAGKTNYEPLIKTCLDPTNNEFVNAIMENLPAVNKEVLSGSVYLAKDAQANGLIDRIGGFDVAVKEALNLANTVALHSAKANSSQLKIEANEMDFQKELFNKAF